MQGLDNNRNKLKFIDLFAGIGGFRIAFENLGLSCVFSSDIDKQCQKVYEHNFHEKPFEDITKIKAEVISDFDILTAGFPCQPFSYSGRLRGFEDEVGGTLFFDIVKILKKKNPTMFLLENVKGLVSHKRGETLSLIEETLTEKLGYTIFTKVLNSHDFGVPQIRERWFCVGFKDEVPFKFPVGRKPNATLKSIVDAELEDKSLALSDFEIKRILYHFKSNKIRVQHDNSKYEPNTKKGKHGVFSYMKPDGTLRFHIGDFAKTQIQEAYYVSIHSAAPAIIATREPKMWDLKRYLSVEECKKLQGFPDWFEFNVSDRTAKKQLGNAVTVPVVEAIAKNMLASYDRFYATKQLEINKVKSETAAFPRL